jgi:predicted ATPase with chaperone activity
MSKKRISIPVFIAVCVFLVIITFQITFLAVSQMYRGDIADANADGVKVAWESKMEYIDALVQMYYLKEIPLETLEDVLRILSDKEDCSDLYIKNRIPGDVCIEHQVEDNSIMDFSEIIGQEAAKRGLEIAAAGSHNAILLGSPGSGKSSLAKAMAGILPPMSLEETTMTIL